MTSLELDGPDGPRAVNFPLHMQVKADASCAVVAAARSCRKVTIT